MPSKGKLLTILDNLKIWSNIKFNFQVATLVSFAEGSGGNVPWLKEFASDNLIQLILKFKTNHSDGLLVYGVDGSSVFSLKIESGMLKFKSGGTEVSSVQSTRYDDDQWHFVLAAHTNDYLSLLIDDYDNFKYVTCTILIIYE